MTEQDIKKNTTYHLRVGEEDLSGLVCGKGDDGCVILRLTGVQRGTYLLLRYADHGQTWEILADEEEDVNEKED